MKFTSVLAATVVTMAIAAPASAMDARLFPYDSRENHCPSGLQPVVWEGVISCGVPNQTISHAQMQAHPAGYRKAVRRSDRRLVCPAGEKGCFYE